MPYIFSKFIREKILKFAMVNADHTIKEQTEQSESMRHLIVKSVLQYGLFYPAGARLNRNIHHTMQSCGSWSSYFRLMESGEKPFELRKNDRGFLSGHELLLHEYNQHAQTYTGRTLRRKITYVLQGHEAENFGLKPGFCIMGLKEM